MTASILPNDAQLIVFGDDDARRRYARAENFDVEWFAAGDGERAVESADEIIAIFFGAGGVIRGADREAVIHGPSVVIAPPGRYAIAVPDQVAVVLSTGRPDLDGALAINPARPPDPNVRPVGAAFKRISGAGRIHVLPFESIEPPADNKRIRFVQSATMSINLVAYDGPRGKKALSPHAHADIQQGTLTLRGRFVHHLRTPWGSDANSWRDDVHLEVGGDALLLIPPRLVHTTEGVGEGAHLLVDIFAPPRRDFRAKGWFFNADDYLDTEAGETQP